MISTNNDGIFSFSAFSIAFRSGSLALSGLPESMNSFAAFRKVSAAFFHLLFSSKAIAFSNNWDITICLLNSLNTSNIKYLEILTS